MRNARSIGALTVTFPWIAGIVAVLIALLYGSTCAASAAF
jgi:hypothetical protein